MATIQSGASTVRQRPPALTSQTELEADQEAFFRANLAPESAEAGIAALSFGRPSASPSADVLQPIAERKVTRRRRRPRVSSANGTSFPPLETVNSSNPSRFARTRSSSSLDEEEKSRDALVNKDTNPEGAESLRIEDMTPEQIYEAQQEIAALLSPENVEFLRERGRARLLKPVHIKADEQAARSDGMQTSNLTKGSVGKVISENGIEPPAGRRGGGEVGEAAQDTMDDIERRLWMSDANVELESQKELDQLLSECIGALGPLGSRRFNLSGKLLSVAEEESLPTHLGLHHHGASPANAGYTLPEILLLTRSTVTSQRILSLRMLADVVSLYSDEVRDGLVDSGALGFAFGAFPLRTTRDLGVSGEQAYTEAIEAIVSRFWEVAPNELIPDLYFGSRLYSSNMPEPAHPVFDALAKSGCMPVLAQISRAGTARSGENGMALRSLAMIRALCSRSTAACQAVFDDVSTLEVIKQLAIDANALQPSTTLLATDVLALIIPQIASRGSEAIQDLKKSILNDNYIQKVSVHLSWFMLHDVAVSARRKEAALGTMRFLRSALAFETGLLPVTSTAPAICRLTQENRTAAEAYLTLETYAHSLYTRAANSKEHEEAASSDPVHRDSARNIDREDSFVKDQLSELIPVALTATKFFASCSERSAAAKQAAAGHFAATLLALSTIRMDKATVVRVLDQCSASSRAIQSCPVDDFAGLQRLQALASVSHAGARLLSTIRLEPLFVKREALCLLSGVLAESKFFATRMDRYFCPWRCVANACAEWIATLAKMDCSKKTIELALQVLPYLLDPQIVVDLLSRCLLKVDALRVLNPEITEEQARKNATDLILISLPEFSKAHCGNTQTEHAITTQERPMHQQAGGLFAMHRIIAMWMKHEGVMGAALLVAFSYFRGGLIRPKILFRVLLEASPSQDSTKNELAEYMYRFSVASTEEGQSVLPSKVETTLSVSSTNVNSVVAESVMSLADFVIARGPTADHLVNGKDPAASIVLTFMFSHEVHVSLRQTLWRKTVEECGGGFLYRFAAMLGPKSPFAHGYDTVWEEDVMIAEYTDAMIRGLLSGERCPPVLGKAVLVDLAGRLVMKDGQAALASLRAEMQKRNPLCLESVQTILRAANENDPELSVASDWLQSLMIQI